MKSVQLKYVVYKEGRYYVAQGLDIDISSFATTPQGAAENLREALELYFEDRNPNEVRKIQNPKVETLRFEHA